MKRLIKLIALVTSTLLLVSCGMNESKTKTTKIINNTNDNITIRLGLAYPSDSEYIKLNSGESVEIESTNNRITVLYPRKYWTLGVVYTKENENISVEVNPNNFYIENY